MIQQQQKYFLNFFILLSMFSFSGSITKISNFTQTKNLKRKIKNLTTVDTVDLEIAKIKKKIRLKRLTEIVRIAAEGQSLTQETINETYKTVQAELVNDEAKIKQTLTQEPHPLHFIFKTDHDPNMPQSIYDALCESIREEGLNPHNINLKYLPNPENKPFLNSSSSCYTTPNITIYEASTINPENFQLFAYKRLIFHILLRHNADSLISIEAREANIHAASTNIKLSETGMQFACTYVGGSAASHQHCYEMQLLYELMKRKEELS